MNQPFEMPPPNEDCNVEDIQIDGLKHSKSTTKNPHVNLHVTSDPYFQATSEFPYNIVDAWDGWLFTDMVRENTGIVDVLEELQDNGWSHSLRKKLSVAIQKLFNSGYFAEEDLTRAAHKQRFIDACPDYIEQGGQWPPAFEPLTAEEKRIAARSFEHALPVIVLWAMCNFSHFRMYWTTSSRQNAKPLNVRTQSLTQAEQDEPVVEKYTRKRLLQATIGNGRRAQESERKKKLAAMSPAERDKFLKREKLRRDVMRAYRAGKIEEQVLIDLGIIEAT